jgi:hypothetical protein
MSRVHIFGASRASIIKERTRNWVATSNGTQHLCLRHCTDGNVLWGLWERVDADGSTRYISCDVLLRQTTGWGYESMLEQDEPEHVSCPPSYLRESPGMSRIWRDQVLAYWSQQRAPRAEFPKPAQDRACAQRFLEGDRVRYIGPTTPTLYSGATGMIVRGTGPFGASIHADELCNSVFVNWDKAATSSVFISRLESESAAGSQPLDEASGNL